MRTGWGKESTNGPDLTIIRTQNSKSTVVEHLGDNRDIPKLEDARRINGFGTVVPPPDTNGSMSTVGRTAPTFSIEGRTYRFQFINGKPAYEVKNDASKFTQELGERNQL